MKFIVLFICLFATPAFAEVAVIVNPAVSAEVDQGSVAGLYLGRTKALPDGTELSPVVQPPSSTVAEDFYKAVLKKSGAQFKAYWSKLVFTGKGKPLQEAKTDAEVIALVAANPDLIGYVDAGSVDESVRVAAKF